MLGYRALPCVTVLGAKMVGGDSLALNASASWDDFGSYFKGWVDEVRIWDGARTAVQIRDDQAKRYSFDDVKATFPSLFGDRPAHIRRAELEYAKKFPSRDTLRAELTALQAKWPELSARIRAQLLPFEEVRANLKKAGAPVEPEEIGVTRARFRETLRGVPYMRSRYFGLDLVLELGLMDALTDRLFGKQGIWEV